MLHHSQFSHIQPNDMTHSNETFSQIFSRYLHRFDEELQQINEQNSIKGRQGRAHASREDTLRNVIERERELYNTCGIGRLIVLDTIFRASGQLIYHMPYLFGYRLSNFCTN